MNRFNAVLRQNTLRCLKGRWGKAVAGTLFLFGVGAVILLLEQFCLSTLSLFGPAELQVPFLAVSVTPAQSAVSVLFWLIGFLTTAPLIVGTIKWYYRLAEGPTPDLRMIFDWYSDGRLYAKAVGLSLAVMLKTAVFAALMFLLPAGLRAAQQQLSGFDSAAAAVGEALLFVLLAVMTAVTVLLVICFGLRYFLAVYYLSEDSSITVRQAMKCSVKAMKGMKGRVLSLLLGRLPLLLSCIFLIPLIFVIPYMSTVFAINARWLMGREVRNCSGSEPSVSGDTVVF